MVKQFTAVVVVHIAVVVTYSITLSEVTNRELAKPESQRQVSGVMIDCTFLAAWFQQHEGEGYRQGLSNKPKLVLL